MENISYWQLTCKLPHYPVFKANDVYDVIIIGGGISGISLAWRLNQQNLKVALLEKDTLASQTTGHTTGKISYLHGVIYYQLAKAYTMAVAKDYLYSNVEAFNEIAKIIKEKQIDCDYQINTAYICANDETIAKKIKQQIEMFKQWGFDVIDNQLPNYQASMGLENQAIFHPLKYLKGLLQECNHIDIFEHSLVSKSYLENDLVNLKVNDTIAKAKKVVWMTRFPINLQNGFFFKMLQEREHLTYQSLANDSNSILDLTTNYSKRMIDQHHCLLINQKSKASWYGQDSKPLRILPYIGKLNDHEYVSYGYDKWGMTLSHVASKLIYDLLISGDSKYANTYSLKNSNYLSSGSDIVKLVKNNFHGMIKNRLLVSKDHHLKANHGKVIYHRGFLVAVYRDSKNRTVYLSPYCPHLRCVVEFNFQDQTWCCPCHGSIFDAYGKLLYGPATRNLKEK